MTGKPKKEPKAAVKSCKKAENYEKSSSADDKQERSYYYDDAHGYEVYDADEDLEDGDDSKF